MLAGEGTKEACTASRCCIINVSECANKEGLKSALEVLGGGSVACNVIGNTAPRFSFPTCHCQCLNAPVIVLELQRYLRIYLYLSGILRISIDPLLKCCLVFLSSTTQFLIHLC